MVRFRRAVPALASVLVGATVGLGVYTFLYARGYSYLSNDPGACANCHVMQAYFDTWSKSSHHARAACNDCHTPHALPAKYAVKAENGWNHSLRFTLQDFNEPIRIRPASAAVVQRNCLRCHGEMTSEIGGDLPCVHCHAGVAHGARR